MSQNGDSFTRREFLNGLGGSVLVATNPSSLASLIGAGGSDKNVGGVEVAHESVSPVKFWRGQTAYIVASPRPPLDRQVVGRLSDYLAATTGRKPELTDDFSRVPENSAAIVLARVGERIAAGVTAPEGSPEGFALATRKVGRTLAVIAVGNSDQGLRRAVDRLILKSRQGQDGLEIPPLNISEKPWIPEREWTMPGHEARNQVWGIFNPYADERLNVYKYSRRQMTHYVAMYSSFGFTGMQLTDTCYDWGVWGSEEAFHDRLITLAQIAKQDGQNVTLRTWSADFSEANWYEPQVTYKKIWSSNLTPAAGLSAFDDPNVRKVFEKYYDYYADLAPYLDLMIGYYDDPGSLSTEDSFKYLLLLESKMKAKNPAIKMAVNCWGQRLNYLQQLTQHGLPGYLVLETVRPPKTEADREEFHQAAARYNWKIGVWGWYDADIESDQAAAMYVFPKKLKQLYEEVRNGAAKIHPISYWSEMEAYHLCDIYSMYVAGQLLWNPERDPEELLSEVTEGIWGPQNGPKVLAALQLVEDVRSGAWELWQDCTLGTADPAQDLHRAESSLAELQSMETNSAFVPKFPLPFSPDTLVDVILPHLKQIRAFAQWRIEFDRIRAGNQDGASKDELSRQIAESWRPIPSYNTWTGTYGQMERMSQEISIRNFAKESGISVSAPGWLRYDDAHCALQFIRTQQILRREVWRFTSSDILSDMGSNWPLQKLQDCLNKLVADGCVEKVGDDLFSLPNWDHYSHGVTSAPAQQRG